MAGVRSDFQAFADLARAQGFDEVIERVWAPLTVLDTHPHPFAVQALVVAGEMWLGVDGRTRHLHAGDAFTLERDVPHTERYGAQGATYWVARRRAGVLGPQRRLALAQGCRADLA